MSRLLPLAVMSLAAWLLAGCSEPQAKPSAGPVELEPATRERFDGHWYQGWGEITSYDLDQARYGGNHPGEAVLIFVTEPFSAAKQVKLDRPQAAGADLVPVFKLNASREFLTGVYPYSVFQSTFVPADPAAGGALKSTLSVQEWCGHVFTQLNRRPDGWHLTGLSYFEGEGDERRVLPEAGALLEDELMLWLRRDPASLPLGRVRLVQGLLFNRFAHRPLVVEEGEAALDRAPDARFAREFPANATYRLAYPSGRRLEITFHAKFPYEILGWRETSPSPRFDGSQNATVTTTATRRKALWLDYWSRNRPDDRALREKLGLSTK